MADGRWARSARSEGVPRGWMTLSSKGTTTGHWARNGHWRALGPGLSMLNGHWTQITHPSTDLTPMRSVNPYSIYCSIAMFRLIAAFSPTTRRTSPTFFRIPSRAFALFAKTSSSIDDRPIPTILLAGFLGSGKTTTLKHLLENNQSIKIGTIVNDVASVNIDAKLVSNTDSLNDSQAEGVVELQNGCACCSLADELMESVMQITSVGGEKRDLDAIVVELSGVADPVSVRDNWKMAELQGHPATKLASLHRTVTVVDSSTFGTDWMTWDAAGDRDDWTEPADGHAAMRKIPELLAEQVEAADLLLINKVDLAGGEQTKIASGLARGLNEKATIREVEFGKVEAKELLGSLELLKEEMEHDHSHEHSHGHSHEHEEAKCSDPGCTDATHSHSHEHKHSSESSCSDPDCTDTSHSHSHDHSEDSCADPDCTDTSHSHSHNHQSTATDQLGISSFVYKQSRPFVSFKFILCLFELVIHFFTDTYIIF